LRFCPRNCDEELSLSVIVLILVDDVDNDDDDDDDFDDDDDACFDDKSIISMNFFNEACRSLILLDPLTFESSKRDDCLKRLDDDEPFSEFGVSRSNAGVFLKKLVMLMNKLK
jgi:hypothetical protein